MKIYTFFILAICTFSLFLPVSFTSVSLPDDDAVFIVTLDVCNASSSLVSPFEGGPTVYEPSACLTSPGFSGFLELRESSLVLFDVVSMILNPPRS